MSECVLQVMCGLSNRSFSDNIEWPSRSFTYCKGFQMRFLVQWYNSLQHLNWQRALRGPFVTAEPLFKHNLVRPHHPYYVRRLPLSTGGYGPHLKWLNRSRCCLVWGLWWLQGTMYYMGSRSPMGRRNFEGESGVPLWSVGTLCGHLCINSWTDPDAVWVVARMVPRNRVRWGSRVAGDVTMATSCGTQFAITGFVWTIATRVFGWSANKMQILLIPCN